MGKWRQSASLIALARSKIINNNFNYNVLLFKRSERTSFMPNHAVFPGGVIEPSDQSTDWLNHFKKFGINDHTLASFSKIGGVRSTIFKSNEADSIKREVSLRITAIRETFEEVGVLLCRTRDKVNDGTIYGNFNENFDRENWQKIVHNDPTKFLSLCQELDVVPDLWSLFEWSVWLTPAMMKKKFETVFYLVALNDIPNLHIEESEAAESLWMTPNEFLNIHRTGDIFLPPPQCYELSRLANISDIEELAKFAKDRETKGTVAMLPVTAQCTDGMVGLLPGDDMYPENPRECTGVIDTQMTVEEYRNSTKNVHRNVFGAGQARIELNTEPDYGHLSPAPEFKIGQSSKL